MSTEIQPAEREHALAVSPVEKVADLLRLAIDKGIPVEALEKLQGLYERAADRAAAQEFADSLAEFQRECPPIDKNKTADITTKGGSRYSYRYAELDEIARTIQPLLHKRGFSYTWDSGLHERTLDCTCTLRHVNGHQIAASFSCPIDTAAAMSEAQKAAAALSFARRMTLVQVLGLTTSDPDPDAGQNVEPITAEQIGTIEGLLAETHADRARFLKWAGVASVEEIRASAFAACVQTLRARQQATPPVARPTPPASIAEPPKKPAPKPEKGGAAEDTVIGQIQILSEKPGERKDGSAFTKYSIKIAGRWFGHFSDSLQQAATTAKARRETVELEWVQSGQYQNAAALTTLEGRFTADEDR